MIFFNIITILQIPTITMAATDADKIAISLGYNNAEDLVSFEKAYTILQALYELEREITKKMVTQSIIMNPPKVNRCPWSDKCPNGLQCRSLHSDVLIGELTSPRPALFKLGAKYRNWH